MHNKDNITIDRNDRRGERAGTLGEVSDILKLLSIGVKEFKYEKLETESDDKDKPLMHIHV